MTKGRDGTDFPIKKSSNQRERLSSLTSTYIFLFIFRTKTQDQDNSCLGKTFKGKKKAFVLSSKAFRILTHSIPLFIILLFIHPLRSLFFVYFQVPSIMHPFFPFSFLFISLFDVRVVDKGAFWCSFSTNIFRSS